MILLEIQEPRHFSLRRLSLLDAPAQAIVNPANSGLIHGGGVAALISKAGGPEIQRESRRKAPVPTGKAIHTTAGALPFLRVIHAVGPIWKGGAHKERRFLEQAVQSALEVAETLGLQSVALPAISTGIFGFPIEAAIPCIFNSIQAFLSQNPGSIEDVILCEINSEKAEQIRLIISGLLAPSQSGGM